MSLVSDVPVPKHKLLPLARKQLLSEFQLKDSTIKLILNKLGQEPYNMIRNRDGQAKPSTRWSITIETIWTWNCAIPDEKNRKNFRTSMTVKGETFNRRLIIAEPVFRADLLNLIRQQIKSMGYNRCYNKVIRRTDYVTNTEYDTMLIQVPV